MIPFLLAEIPATDSSMGIVLVVGGLITLLQLGQLATAFITHHNGRANERQIEPTQISAIQTKLDNLGTQAAATSRELGEIKISVDAVDKKVDRLAETQATESLGMFKRINSISTELTATRTRVDGLERREQPKH